MNTVLSKVTPSITSMIRADHTVVLAKFHRIDAHTSAGRKRALANAICLALEIHAQLEEEIFYPALREVCGSDNVLDKSVPEHDAMRAHITALRGMSAEDPGFDRELCALMREVIHHVADEETVLLPEAELRMPERLGELGAQMTKRRMQLLAPRTGELVVSTARGLPMTTVPMLAGIAVAGGLVVSRAMRGSRDRFGLMAQAAQVGSRARDGAREGARRLAWQAQRAATAWGR